MTQQLDSKVAIITGGTSGMSNATANVAEHRAIAKVVQHYIDGARSGRGDDMRPAFHADATVFGYVGADLFAGPIEQLFAWNDANGPATKLQARVAGIELSGPLQVGKARPSLGHPLRRCTPNQEPGDQEKSYPSHPLLEPQRNAPRGFRCRCKKMKSGDIQRNPFFLIVPSPVGDPRWLNPEALQDRLSSLRH